MRRFYFFAPLNEGVILSERSESKNLRRKCLHSGIDGAKILRLRIFNASLRMTGFFWGAVRRDDVPQSSPTGRNGGENYKLQIINCRGRRPRRPVTQCLGRTKTAHRVPSLFRVVREVDPYDVDGKNGGRPMVAPAGRELQITSYKLQIVGGGVLDAPAAKCCYLWLFPANS